MNDVSFPGLETDEGLRSFLYHLKGIIECQDEIRSLLHRLERAYGLNQRETERVLSFIEVQVFDHLEYHIKELREPLSAFLESVYGDSGKAAKGCNE